MTMTKHTRALRITVYRDAKGEYRWRAKSRNGRIVADCAEGYKTRAGAMKAAYRPFATASLYGFTVG